MTTNKENLEKVKPGTKPSTIKKQKVKNTKPKTDEGYESDKSNKSIPEAPPSPNSQIQSLQKKIEIQEAIKKADEKKKQELQEKIKTLIKLAGEEKQEYQQKISDLQKQVRDLDYLLKTGKNSNIIKGLQAKITEQDKTIEELKKQVKNPAEVKELFACYHCHQNQPLPLLVLELPEGKLCQPCWTILRKKTKEQIKPAITSFTCHNCQQTFKENAFKVKLDSTLQEHSICSQCLPTIKEYNEKEQDSDRDLEEWE